MKANLLKNNTGMSLLEVMMAISIMAIISLGVMQLSKNMNKTSRTATKNFDIESAMREIQIHLSNKDNCSATVFGAANTGDTRISGMKKIDLTSGIVETHPTLRVSTMASPRYIGSGMIINGMFLRHMGANTYELNITFMKSVRAGQGAVKAQDATYGQNLITRKIALELDNCSRYVASGNSAIGAAEQCSTGGGQVVGNAVGIYSPGNAASVAAGIADTQFFVACRVCSSPSTVNGCL